MPTAKQQEMRERVVAIIARVIAARPDLVGDNPLIIRIEHDPGCPLEFNNGKPIAVGKNCECNPAFYVFSDMEEQDCVACDKGEGLQIFGTEETRH